MKCNYYHEERKIRGEEKGSLLKNTAGYVRLFCRRGRAPDWDDIIQ